MVDASACRYALSSTSPRRATRPSPEECRWRRKQVDLAGGSRGRGRDGGMCLTGFRNKNVRNPLQTALSTYFCIWMVYPVLWLLLKTKVIDQVTEHCINVVMDVLAKSMCEWEDGRV